MGASWPGVLLGESPLPGCRVRGASEAAPDSGGHAGHSFQG